MTHSPRVLVIEDDPLLLQAIEKKLAVSGCTPIPCSTGQKGLAYLNSGEQKPDIIWLDYYLTDMNGLGFMHQIKKHPEWMHIPLIVVSNSASDDTVHAMLALGADKYMLKADHKLEEIITIAKTMTQPKEGG
jgi:CheY-like chemotaxis protein